MKIEFSPVTLFFTAILAIFIIDLAWPDFYPEPDRQAQPWRSIAAVQEVPR